MDDDGSSKSQSGCAACGDETGSDPVPTIASSSGISGPDAQLQTNAAASVSLSRNQPAVAKNDIGLLIRAGMRVQDVSSAISRLDIGQKDALIFDHENPTDVLPSRYSHGCQRKFNTVWLDKYNWLRYSSEADGVFCGPCAVMLNDEQRIGKGYLVNSPFSNWVKLSDALSAHSKLCYHQDCVAAADVMHNTIVRPAARIDVMTNVQLRERQAKNRHILRQIVRAILYLAKQGIPLRGDREAESMADGTNPGNFLALLKEFAAEDSILREHLVSPRVRYATYISPRTQNDIINIIANDIILPDLVTEVKGCPFFSILADEVTSHNTEHLAICIHFVDAAMSIREEFVSFVKLARVRAMDIANALQDVLKEIGLQLTHLRGQGYDGASTMSGEQNGVQRLLLDKQPKALYTHCAGHSLNLVITKSCQVPAIRNCISSIKDMTLWLKNSPKREGFFKAISEKQTMDHSATTLLNVCVTRWVENIDGWEKFSTVHPFLVTMCEGLIYGDNDYPNYSDNWPAEDKRNAMAHLKTLQSFDFVYSLVVLQRCLLYLRGAAVKLQGKSQDISSGVKLVKDCHAQLQKLRTTDLDDYSSRVIKHAERIAERSGVLVAKPRTTQRQQHRANVEAPSVQKYFELSVLVPFLDHLISDLESRFSKHVTKAGMVQGILPTFLTQNSVFSDI